MGIRYYPKVVVAVPFTPATGDRVLVAPGRGPRGRRRASSRRRAREWCERVKGVGRARALPARGRGRRRGRRAGTCGATASSSTGSATARRRSTSTSRASTSKQRNQIKRELRGVREAGHRRRDAAARGPHARGRPRRCTASTRRPIDKHGVWGRLYLNERVLRDRRRALPRPPGLGRRARRPRAGASSAGAFNVVKRQAPLRPLLGRRASDVPVPALRRLLLRGHPRTASSAGIDVFEPGAGGEHKRARGFVPTLTRSAHWLADAPAARSAPGSSASARASRRSWRREAKVTRADKSA